VRVTPTPHGIALYFPPLRAGHGPLALALFGALCIALPMLALPALIPHGGDAHGLLGIALIGTFIVPFPAFGAAFMALATYALANSLSVEAGPEGIRTVRCMLGIALRRRTIARGDIAAVELREVPRYRNVLGAGTRFDLVVRSTGQPGREVVVAEDLESEAAAEQTRALIVRHAGLHMN
jgi:hypothetical protein